MRVGARQRLKARSFSASPGLHPADVGNWKPQKAVLLFTRLFSYLPPDGNEVLCSREELARVVGSDASHVSKIMGELEAVGAVYRRKEGRGVRYFVNPLLGTHLAGAARDKAQAEAPRLQLVE